MPRKKVDRRQLSLARVLPHPAWATRKPPGPTVLAPELAPELRAQLEEFEVALVGQGPTNSDSARTYRKALACVAKQAERHLGRPIRDVWELFSVELLAFLAKDDAPFDARSPQLGNGTLRQRRGVLSAWLRAIPSGAMTFEEGRALLKRAFRQAGERSGSRYVIRAGRPPSYDPRIPAIADVERFIAVAGASGNAFAGPRIAAAAGLALYEGLRPVSILSIDGTDFRISADGVYLMVREKAARGKRARREIRLRAEAQALLQFSGAAFNSYNEELGRDDAIGFGLPGPFFRGTDGGRWRYSALLRAFDEGCRRAGVPRFTARDLRHLFGSGLAAVLPLDRAAAAGDWLSELVPSRHYMRSLRDWRPRGREIRPRLIHPGIGARVGEVSDGEFARTS